MSKFPTHPLLVTCTVCDPRPGFLPLVSSPFRQLTVFVPLLSTTWIDVSSNNPCRRRPLLLPLLLLIPIDFFPASHPSVPAAGTSTGDVCIRVSSERRTDPCAAEPQRRNTRSTSVLEEPTPEAETEREREREREFDVGRQLRHGNLMTSESRAYPFTARGDFLFFSLFPFSCVRRRPVTGLFSASPWGMA